jgi:ribosomal protein S18 acetylase RimI-like enzyme
MNAVKIVEADLRRPKHQAAVLELLDEYSRDPMGNGAPLPAEVVTRLIPGLRAHPTTLVFLAYNDGAAVGLAVCFRGFSTFAAKPLINIHDLVVLPAHRGLGIGRLLLDFIAEKGRTLGCCKLTLEVLENNRRARGLYASAGFTQATYRPEAGGAIFMTKTLQAAAGISPADCARRRR